MPILSRPDGARGKGTSKPFNFSISLRTTAWSAATASALCLAMLVPSLASSPRSETGPAALPQQNARQLVPFTHFVAVPSDTITNALPTVPAPAISPEKMPEGVAPEAKMLPPTKVKGAFPRGLHPVIKHSMVEASRYLPEGWQLEFMNALRDAPGVWNGPHGKRDKTGGALAVDVWLVNPKGERLCNFQCRQNFEPYQTFMQMVKHIQDRDFPAYRNQGRWGGYFGGRYANDEMHYDLEPTPWTAAGNWEKGLFAGYAHFGKPGDVGKGMGSIAGYRLPENGTLVSMATPPAVTAPVVAAQNVAVNKPSVAPVVTAPATPVVQKVSAVAKPVAVQARKVQYRQAQYRPRPSYQADDDETPRSRRRGRVYMEEAENDAPVARVRYAQYSRSARRGGRQMRDYSDD